MGAMESVEIPDDDVLDLEHLSAPAELAQAETAVAELIGKTFTTASEPVVEPVVTTSDESEKGKVAKFQFDTNFQSHVCRLALRDEAFLNHTAHLLRPDYFEHVGEALLVDIALNHFREYHCLPSHAALNEILRNRVKAKTFRKDDQVATIKAAKDAYSGSVHDREFFEDKVAEFVRHQAVTQAIYDSVDMINRGQFDKIGLAVKEALDIGVNRESEAYDYFAKIGERTEKRLEKAAGVKGPAGITTGHAALNKLLYHGGWGRKEMVTILGGAKAGKTTALINFGLAAALTGHNVLYLTLEVSEEIISDRLDACVSDIDMKSLRTRIKDVETKVAAMQARSGKFEIIQYPTGSLTCNHLRQVIERYKAKGIIFDMLVVDYADIMAPNFRYNDPIENSKSVYVDLRAIAVEENLAVLTATQTNRDGYKAAVAKAEHTAEDFNKVRIVDLMISINSTDEERASGEARLYFAASRNQEGGFTVFIKQNLSKMRFIESVIRHE